MLQSWDFQLSTQIQFGRGALRKLGDLVAMLGPSVLLVGYRDRAGLEEAYERAGKSLVKAGVRTTTFFEVAPEPEVPIALRGAEVARQAGAEVIVAVGGGSVIDAAKGIAALARGRLSSAELFDASPDPQPVRNALPVVAIPTTAGTGSEVSDIAVFSAPSSPDAPGDVLKIAIFGPALRPSLAVIDPDLTLELPGPLTAAGAADALGHAIEASMSRRANPLASLAAGRAVALIAENLPRALQQPHDPAPREALALAAMLAGIAFASAGVVVGHALAQAMGGVLHVSHGAAVALATPVSLRYNAACCGEIYAQLARHCGLPADPPNTLPARWIDFIAGLLRDAGLPDRVPMGPETATQGEELVARLVGNVRRSAWVPVLLNPRKTDEAALADLFRQVVD